MISLLLLTLPLCAFAFPQEKYGRISVTQVKRQTTTCDQTYGAGAQLCGDSGSAFCFNPSLGQSCCATDSGFCDAGKYCAPVAGYCCLEGEDLATCAQNAGFALPNSASNTSSTDDPAMDDSTTVAGPTVTVVPLSLESAAVPAPASAQDGGCSFTTTSTNLTAPAPSFVSNANAHTNGTVPSVVQVSSATKRISLLAGPMAIGGLSGVLTMLF
ncbi:hypothetical protein GGR54DRAFT_556232 [Hypoxylon sp. NC1633]|nr:hypothetical protein GGR54DRAFT_556232 [Hypoxylon sp. NC1633]